MGKHKKPVDCSACGGSGKQTTTDDGDQKKRVIPCVMCNGTGTV